jgi:SAM-dependent methyltransferase
MNAPSLDAVLRLPPVLDVCCGGRMMWFDKHDRRALYVDIRRETVIYEKTPRTRRVKIDPDLKADFRKLPLPDDTFHHVVFDPPHILRLGKKSWMRKKYGALDRLDWRESLRDGFRECFRVLKPGGTLVFKWSEWDIPVSEILKLTPEKPLYGQRCGKAAKTHWIVFTKPNNNMRSGSGFGGDR